MKQLLSNTRSKYIFALGLLAIFIGVISRKVISYPKECLPSINNEITYSINIK